DLVSLRVTVIGTLKKPPQQHLEEGRGEPPKEALRGTRQVYFREKGGMVSTPVYLRTALLAGNRINGPALIEEHASTTVVAPGDTLKVDNLGNLDIQVGAVS